MPARTAAKYASLCIPSAVAIYVDIAHNATNSSSLLPNYKSDFKLGVVFHGKQER
jgi:hypothetical protein